MTLCTTCEVLVAKLHSRPGRIYDHKNLLDLLDSASDCELCNLVVCSPFVSDTHDADPGPTFLLASKDNQIMTPIPKTFKPLTGEDDSSMREKRVEPPCLNHFNREGLFDFLKDMDESGPDDFPLFKVRAEEDIDTRISQVTFYGEAMSGLVRGHVSLAVWRDSTCATENEDCPRHNPSQEVKDRVNQSGAERAWFRFQSCSHSDVAYRPHGMSFTGSSITELELLKSWVLRCEETHYKCCFNARGDRVYDDTEVLELGVKAPMRLLKIENDSIKLIERVPLQLMTDDPDNSNGALFAQMHYPYVALSHCWGPDVHHPPKTTWANFDQQMKGIPLSSLPLSFHDAVRIALYLDTEYLWIDSLCIVQDDNDDWKKESARMDEIYEGARFTIAAADAPYSQAGCFVADRPDLQDLYQRTNTLERPVRCKPPDSPCIAIPTVSRSGLPVTINFAPVPVMSENPYHSRLGQRGWAVQEWYLSRRVVFFTQGGLAWKCKDIQFDERGNYFDMHEKLEWEHLLQRYSETMLTRETDRLVALQGIVNVSAAKMPGTFHFGLWTHMPELLLWSMNAPQASVGRVDAPSWSWASRTGPKFFFKTMLQYRLCDTRQDLLESDICVDQDGTLLMVAPMLEVESSVIPKDPETWNLFETQYFPYGPDFCPESALFHLGHTANLPALFIHQSGTTDVAIGVGICDEDFIQGKSPLFCLLLTCTHKVVQGEAQERIEGSMSYAGNDGKNMLWFLLVAPIEGKTNHYRRLGMGVIGSVDQVAKVSYGKVAIV